MGGQPGTSEGKNEVLGHEVLDPEVEVLGDCSEVEVLDDGDVVDARGESEQQL